MKKVLISLFTIIFAFAAVAQNAPMQKINPASVAIPKQAAKTGRETGQPEMMTSPVVRATLADPAGHSYYDLQTNASLSKRIISHEDGTVSMIWNTSNTQATSRGTGYNYFDGTSLVNNSMPIERIENTRTGWGTIGTLGTDNNIGEVVVSHNGTTGLVVLTRETKGTGTWKSSGLTGPVVTNDHGPETSTCLLWPAIATVADTIHLVACTESDTGYRYNGIQTCLLYYRGVYDRSTQNVTWTSPVIVGDMTSAKQTNFSGDGYSISANGSHVAVLYGESATDIFYWLSNDGGVNWDKHIIFDTPVPDAFDPTVHLVLDTPFVSDGSNSIVVDDNGIVHVAFSITRLLNDEIATTSYSWYPLYDALIYWNSTMEPLTDESNPRLSLDPALLEAKGIQVFRSIDLTGEGDVMALSGGLEAHMVSYTVTLVSQPQLAWDNGKVYITFCAEIEYPFVQWDMNKMYRGVFAAKSTDNGTTWNDDEISWISYGPDFMYMDWRAYDGLEDPTNPEQVVSAIRNYSENTFPAISNVADGKISILWQSGYLPGSFIRENSTAAVCTAMVDMNWLRIDVDSIGIFNNYKEIPTGVWNMDVVGVQTLNSIKEVNIFPNPASNNVKVVIETTENAPASVTVTNLLGQTVHVQQISISAGENVLDLNVSGYPSGFYMINIKTGTGNSTKKLIVQ